MSSKQIMYGLVLTLFIGLVPIAALAQNESDDAFCEETPTSLFDDPQLSVKGFVDTYHSVRSQSPYNFMSSRTRFRGELSYKHNRSSMFCSFNLIYNPVLKQQSGFQLREAYFDYQANHWGVKLGRQLVIWGVADAFRITDLVSPMDMTEFLAQDYDDIRMPVNALRAFVHNSSVKLELIAVPTFEGFIIPTDTRNPWSMTLPSGVSFDNREAAPKFEVKNIEYGGRVSFTLPGIDFSIAGLHTFNKMPILELSMTPQGATIRPKYYRMGFVGGDLSVPLGATVLRGEVALNLNKPFNHSETLMKPIQQMHSANWLVGADWYAPNQWMVSAQVASEQLLNAKEGFKTTRSWIATCNVSKKLLGETLQLGNFTYFDIQNTGWFTRFYANYSLSDQVTLTAGYDWLGGDKGMFSQYSKNSELFVKAKYAF